MTYAVFTYGTLMVASVMRAVTGREIEAEAAYVRGFERFQILGAVYPGLLSTGRGGTAGVLYRGVDSETLAALDRFEGDLYERCAIEVECAAESPQRAQCWVVPASEVEQLEDTPWSLEGFERLHLDAYLEMCREFRREDAKLYPSKR